MVELQAAHHPDTHAGGLISASATSVPVWPNRCDRRFLVGQDAITCNDPRLMAHVATCGKRYADLAKDRFFHIEDSAAIVTRRTRTEHGEVHGLQAGGDGDGLVIAAAVCALWVRHLHICFVRGLLRVVALLRHRLRSLEQLANLRRNRCVCRDVQLGEVSHRRVLPDGRESCLQCWFAAISGARMLSARESPQLLRRADVVPPRSRSP